MRLAGTISGATRARRFQDYLLTLGIQSSLRENSDTEVAVWVIEEDALERARGELERFVTDPDQSEFVRAERDAAVVRAQEIEERRARAAREIDFARRWTPPTWRDVPVTLSLILLSACIQWVLVSSGASTAEFTKHPLGRDLLMSPAVASGQVEPTPWIPPEVAGGQIWRLLSPVLLHFGVVHLVMNCFMLFWLGIAIEGRRGTPRFAFLALIISMISNYAQYLWMPNPFGGLSGLLFGMVGYAWMKSRFEPRYGIQVTAPFVAFCLFWMVLCIASDRDIANTAHVVGLLTGLIIGIAPTLWHRLQNLAAR